MKLVRFGDYGEERPGIWLEEGGKAMILDVRAAVFDIEDYNEHFFSHYGLKRLENLLRERKRKLVPADGIRIGAPVAGPNKIICLKENYAGYPQAPSLPVLFSKATTAIIGPNDPVILPPGCAEVNGKAELAVVIGRRARNVGENEAYDYIAGYTMLNDVADRGAQQVDRQWFRGGSSDTFCPVGPWLVTRDEISDPHNLKLMFVHNGAVLQNDSTAKMIFKIPFIIAFISATITLLPGDVIATGSPAGIGSVRNPTVVFRQGDKIELTIERLGRQFNKIVSG